jgi:hypothetical protein
VLLPKPAALGTDDRAAGASVNNVACRALVARRSSARTGRYARYKAPASLSIVASVGAVSAGITIVTTGARRAEHCHPGLINQRTRKSGAEIAVANNAAHANLRIVDPLRILL